MALLNLWDSTYAILARSLVGWISGRLDLSVRPRNGGCGSGSSLTEIKLLSSKYSDTYAKLQDISSVLDDGTLLAELDANNLKLNISLVKSEMRDWA
jgi:hypothetical protein